MASVREAVRESRPAPAWLAPEAESRWWQVWVPRFGLATATAALVAVALASAFQSGIPQGFASFFVKGGGTTIEPMVQRLEDRFPDLPPEVLRSLDEESYVLDRMTVRPASSGNSRVVAPVDYEPGGAVYVTF
jgi:hypothetical protein